VLDDLGDDLIEACGGSRAQPAASRKEFLGPLFTGQRGVPVRRIDEVASDGRRGLVVPFSDDPVVEELAEEAALPSTGDGVSVRQGASFFVPQDGSKSSRSLSAA
jgi:hypothetical protein